MIVWSRKARRRIPALLTLSTVMILLLRLSLSPNGLSQTIDLMRKVHHQQHLVDKLTVQNHTLKLDILSARNHPQWLELQARRMLGMIKKGETLYRFQ